MSKKLVQIKNLKTYFHTEAGTAKAVDNVSFDFIKVKYLESLENQDQENPLHHYQ